MMKSEVEEQNTKMKLLQRYAEGCKHLAFLIVHLLLSKTKSQFVMAERMKG
jgi:hypothetical protein